MSDSSLPPLSSRAPEHAAPERRWLPISGWAVAAFVASLVGILVGLVYSWWPLLIPFAIGVAVLVLVPASTRRGRALAGWAVGISLVMGTCSYGVHSTMRNLVMDAAGDLLTALAAEPGPEPGAEGAGGARQGALKKRIRPEAIEAGAIERFERRYAAVVARLGPYAGTVRAGTVFSGMISLLVPPPGAEEIPADEADALKEAPELGAWFWAEATFRDGEAWVALRFLDARSEGVFSADAAAEEGLRVVDLRFFRAGAPRPAPPP